jgi:CBS domain-containing protein
MNVADLMTRDVTCVRANEPLSIAAELMWSCDCGAVPVLDDQGERVVGMITDRDICMATWTQDSAPSSVPIHRAMSRELFSCSPRDTLANAERVMQKHQVRRVPVIDDDGRLVGILSLADVARRADGAPRTKDLDPDDVASTLATICAPRSNGTTAQTHS